MVAPSGKEEEKVLDHELRKLFDHVKRQEDAVFQRQGSSKLQSKP